MEEDRKCKAPRRWAAALVSIFAFFHLLPFSESSNLSRYREALSKSLLYFEAQRSGHLPYNQRVPWRHHSGLTDGLEQGVDLVGGYYDAGDNVKFGLPMAFTITMLSWSVIQYGEEIAAAGEYRHALEAIKWGTDYFIKAHSQPHVLWVQVGDGDTDHYCWQRPEDMTTSRRAYKIDEDHPGSDVAGETAAAMAAASIVFRRTNPHYSQLLLDHAQQLGMKKKHEEHSQILQEYRFKAEYYICACLNKNNTTNIHRTPGGLIYIRQWNNMQYVSSATFLLMAYSDHLRAANQKLNCHGGVLVGPDDISSFAKSQVDYILGSNPMAISYLVGYGSRYPQRVHHRGASMESYRNNKGFIGCTQGYDNWYGRQESNPNVLVGALVGGPDIKDQFRDGRENYVQTEACTYNTAPLVGVFANLHALEQKNTSHVFDPPLIASS
ncbi:endoglucanase 11-like isoform X2 [Coffea arabica]|uniref:Endoglucanase n=1 Tax=Coffea arabica TaxID=13443 RepID=A0ABM4UJX6_COFAR